jgi:uncharacterized protein YbaR (Trm112 family)
METTNLCCPSCKTNLTLPAEKAKNEKLILVCPKCKYSGNLNSFIKLQNPLIAEPKDHERVVDPTVIAETNFQAALTIGVLAEKKTKEKFQLKQGLNRFGRKSSCSVCEHQFSNGDTFISRNHFEINVVFNKANLYFEHRLLDLGSVNGTLVNGNKLAKGDIVLLKAGDKLKVGKTELTFELK